MFEYLYDDYFHLGQSCFQVENNFSYRPIIYRIFCGLNNNILAIKALSLLSIIISIYIIYKLLVKEKIIYKSPHFFAILLNPLILFPVFYTSQFTTAITLLWCMLCYHIISKKFKLYDLITFLILGLIGLGLRFESFYYLILIVMIFFIIFWANFTLNNSQKISFILIKTFFNKQNNYRSILIKSVSFVLTFFLISTIVKFFNSYYPSQFEVLEVYKTTTQEYPPITHLFIQIYALILYLINFILPATYSFFGPWSDWIKIDQSSLYQVSLGLAYFLALFSSFYFSFFKYQHSQKKWPYIGLLIFIISHTILSFRMRVDWYFVTRQFVGSIFLYISFYCFIQTKSYFRKISTIVIIYFLFSTTVQVLFHFKDLTTFATFEYTLLGNKSPNATMYYIQKVAHKNQKAEILKKTIEELQPQIRDQSQIAIKFFDDLSFLGYITGLDIHNSELREYFYQKSMETHSYSSALVCLLEPEERWKTCLLPKRIYLLCKTIREGTMINHRKLPLKFDLDEYCKNKF